MKNFILFLALALTVFQSCSDNSAQQQALEQEAWDNMMVIHDEVMPLMGELNANSRQLKSYMSENEVSDETKASIEAMIVRLENANEGMMDWMADVHATSPEEARETQDHEAVMAGIQASTETVEQVNTDMKSALEDSNKLIGDLNSEE